MKIVAKTDQGKVRKDNQDSFAAGELPGGVVWAVVCAACDFACFSVLDYEGVYTVCRFEQTVCFYVKE